MKSIWIAWKDFTIRLRDRRGFLLMVVMPLVLTAILGSALGGAMGDDRLPETVVAYYQEDADSLGIMLKQDVLQGEQLKDLVKVKEAQSREEVRQLMQEGKADAGIILPAGWGADIGRGTLKEPILLTDPAKDIQGTMTETILLAFLHQAQATAVSMQTVMSDLAGAVPASTGQLNLAEVSKDIQAKLQQTAASVREETTGGRTVSSMQYYAAGMGVMFLLFNITVGAKMLISERATETLARLLCTPTRPLSILFGKFLGTWLFASVQFLLFITVTHYGFQVDWGNDSAQVLAVGLAYSLCVSGLSMLAAALIRNEKTADVAGGVGIQVLALLGGSMLPVYSFPDALRTLSKLTPNQWALTSFLHIMTGATWAALLPAICILCGTGLVSVIVGTWRLQAR